MSDVKVSFGADTAQFDSTVARLKSRISGVARDFKGQMGGMAGSAQGLSGSFNGIGNAFKMAFSAGTSGSIGSIASGLGGMAASASGAAAALGPVGIGVAAVTAAAAAGVGVLLSFGATMGDLAEKTDQTAQKLGMTTREVQQWTAVVGMSGISSEAFSGTITKLNRALSTAANGSKRTSGAFNALGIDAKNAGTSNEVLLKIADRFKDMPNGPNKTALAFQLLGRAGANLIPFLNQGSEAIEKQKQMAQEYGAVMGETAEETQAFVQKGLDVDQAMDEMALGMQGVRNVLFDALAPAINEAATTMNDLIKSFVESYKSGGMVKQIIDGLGVAFQFMGDIVSVVMDVAGSILEIWFEITTSVFEAVSDIIESFTGGLTSDVSIWEGVFRGIMATLQVVAGAFRIFGSIVGGIIRALGKTIAGLADIIKMAFSLDFSGAIAAFNQWRSDVTDIAVDVAQRVVTDFQDTVTTVGDTVAGRRRRTGGTAQEEAPDGEDADMSYMAANRGKGKGNNAQAARDAAYRVQISELAYQQELAAATNNRDQIVALEEQKLAAALATYGANSEQYREALRDRERLTRRHQQEVDAINTQISQHRMALEEEAVSQTQTMGQQELEMRKQVLDQRLANEEITAVQHAEMVAVLHQQELDLEEDHQTEMYRIRLQGYRDQQALLSKTPEEKAAIDREIERLEREHQNAMAQIRGRRQSVGQADQNNVQTAKLDSLKKIADPLASSFETTFQNILSGADSFRGGMIKLMDQLVMDSIMQIARIGLQWASMELAKTAATVFGIGARTSVEATGAATSAAITTATATTQIGAQAAVAGAGAAAATAPIPIVGPAMAPLVAAGIIAAVMGFMSLVSASGGYDIPAGTNPMAQLHAEEMVLPAHIAKPLRTALKGPQSGSIALGGAAMMAGTSAREGMTQNNTASPTFNYQPQITSGGNQKLESMLNKEGATMRRWIGNQIRSGKMKAV